MMIEETSPELSKYIDEMRISISDFDVPEMNIKNLKDYYDSLYALLNSYNSNVNESIQVFCGSLVSPIM